MSDPVIAESHDERAELRDWLVNGPLDEIDVSDGRLFEHELRCLRQRRLGLGDHGRRRLGLGDHGRRWLGLGDHGRRRRWCRRQCRKRRLDRGGPRRGLGDRRSSGRPSPSLD